MDGWTWRTYKQIVDDSVRFSNLERFSYREWIESAGRAHDQNSTWRLHELFARKNRQIDQPEWIDLGGEA